LRLSLFTLGILVGIASLGGRAEAQSYPWCAVYDLDGVTYNCGFTALDQCMATIRGIGGSCERNSLYQPPTSGQRVSHKSHSPS
jgi:hypothetical protein